MNRIQVLENIVRQVLKPRACEGSELDVALSILHDELCDLIKMLPADDPVFRNAVAQPEPVINASTQDENKYVDLHLNKSCEVELRVAVDKDGDIRSSLRLGRGTAKEFLILLQMLYVQEDYEVNARLTKAQYKFLGQLAEKLDMTYEDVIRELVNKNMQQP